MINFDSHSNSELLTLYLDGELNEDQALQFEEILNQDENLQIEMNEQLLVRDAINQDEESFDTPAAATTAVFGALGIDKLLLSGAGSTAVGSGILNTLTSLKFLIPVIATLSTVLVTVGILDDSEDETPSPKETTHILKQIDNSNQTNSSLSKEEIKTDTENLVPTNSSHTEQSELVELSDDKLSSSNKLIEQDQNIQNENNLSSSLRNTDNLHSILNQESNVEIIEDNDSETKINYQDLPFNFILLDKTNFNGEIVSKQFYTSNDKSYLLTRKKVSNSNFYAWKSLRPSFAYNSTVGALPSFAFDNPGMIWGSVDYIKLELGFNTFNNGLNGTTLSSSFLAGNRLTSLIMLNSAIPIAEAGFGYHLGSQGLYYQLAAGYEILTPIEYLDLQLKYSYRSHLSNQNVNLLNSASGLEFGIIVKF